MKRPIRAEAFDVGYTFRYRGAPLNLSVTAALAAGGVTACRTTASTGSTARPACSPTRVASAA